MFGLMLVPATIGKDFFDLVWIFTVVTTNEAKMIPLKIGLSSLGVYYASVSNCKDCYPTTAGKDFLIFFSGFTHHNGKIFLYFASKCKQLYGLLPHHCWQGFFALVIFSVTSNEVKMLPLKMGLPSLGVAFSQARYSLW